MKTASKILAVTLFIIAVCGVNFTGEKTPGLTFVGSAEAIIGRPLTPVSYAGVARRTTRRVVYTEAAVATSSAAAASASASEAQAAAAQASTAASQATTAQTPPAIPVGSVVQALPSGCTPVTVGTSEYQDCGGTFYKAAFQGNNLVYVVVEKPIK